jgi:hypothetical protein
MTVGERTPEQNERVEQLAMDMHRHYRATFKALHRIKRQIGQFQCDAPNHDHGWQECSNKKYFRQRAVREL